MIDQQLRTKYRLYEDVLHFVWEKLINNQAPLIKYHDLCKITKRQL